MCNEKGLLGILYKHLVDYPSPVNVNYFWSIGSLALHFLINKNNIYILFFISLLIGNFKLITFKKKKCWL